MVEIGYVPSPREWSRWPEAQALLRMAQARDPEQREILPPHHIVWVVMDGSDLLAAATARLTVEGDCVVVLVAGRDHHRWLKAMDEKIGAAAREAGATRLLACGRVGWRKALAALGWDSKGDGRTRAYSRALET